MADIYLRSSDGDNAYNGSTWALAKKTLENNGMSSTGDGAITAAGAGGRIFMSDNHAQTEASVFDLSGGTINAPIQILSVDDSQSEGSEVLMTGGSVTCTASSGICKIQGYLYFHGVSISVENVLNHVDIESYQTFEECNIIFTGTNDEWTIGSGGEDVTVKLINTDVDMGATSNTIKVISDGALNWFGGSLVTNTPNILFDQHSNGGTVIVRDVDLSIVSGNLVDPTGTTGQYTFTFERCKLHASLSAVLSTSIQAPNAYIVKLHSCDSANTTHGLIEEYYEGTNTDETGIYRTSGATDGTTNLSIKMASNANAIEVIQPLVSPPIVHWTDSTGVTNFDIEILINSATTLYEEDVWVEIEYHGADAQGLIATSKPDILAAVDTTPLTTSTEAWTGETVEQTYTLRATTTSALAVGPVTARVYLGKASTTIYVDPVITES